MDEANVAFDVGDAEQSLPAVFVNNESENCKNHYASLRYL
jgi:hypothetical protein